MIHEGPHIGRAEQPAVEPFSRSAQATVDLTHLPELATTPTDPPPVPVTIDAHARVDSKAGLPALVPHVLQFRRHGEPWNVDSALRRDGWLDEMAHGKALGTRDTERFEPAKGDARQRQSLQLRQRRLRGIGPDHDEPCGGSMGELGFWHRIGEATADPPQEVDRRKQPRHQQGIPVDCERDQHGRPSGVARQPLDEPELPAGAIEPLQHERQPALDLAKPARHEWPQRFTSLWQDWTPNHAVSPLEPAPIPIRAKSLPSTAAESLGARMANNGPWPTIATLMGWYKGLEPR